MGEVASEHRNVYPDAFVKSFGPSLRNVSMSDCRGTELKERNRLVSRMTNLSLCRWCRYAFS
jgi:hypothetical protein